MLNLRKNLIFRKNINHKQTKMLFYREMTKIRVQIGIAVRSIKKRFFTNTSEIHCYLRIDYNPCLIQAIFIPLHFKLLSGLSEMAIHFV